jgi:sporulation integral membrane protein YtvI
LVKKEYKIIIVIISTALGVYMSFKYIMPLIVPFLIALSLAKMIIPVVNFFYNKLKVPKMLAGAVTLLLLFITLGLGFMYLIKTLVIQAKLLFTNTPIYIDMIGNKINTICKDCDHVFGLLDGSVKKIVDENADYMLVRIKEKIMPMMTEQSLQIIIKAAGILGVLIIIFISVLMILKDMEFIQESYEKSYFYKMIHPIFSKLAYMGFAYLKTQLIIISIITCICTLSFLLIKNKYPLLIGLFIGMFDALPILGSGSILVPWAIFKLVGADIYTAAILLTTYVLCQLIRQILEPKLLGDQIGVKPIFTIMSIYIGIRIFGLSGFFLGPIAFVIILTVVRTQL